MRTFDDQNSVLCNGCGERKDFEELRPCEFCHRVYCSAECARECPCGVRQAMGRQAAHERVRRNRLKLAAIGVGIALVAVIVWLAL